MKFINLFKSKRVIVDIFRLPNIELNIYKDSNILTLIDDLKFIELHMYDIDKKDLYMILSKEKQDTRLHQFYSDNGVELSNNIELSKSMIDIVNRLKKRVKQNKTSAKFTKIGSYLQGLDNLIDIITDIE